MATAKTRKEYVMQQQSITVRLIENSGITLHPVTNEISFLYHPEDMQIGDNMFSNAVFEWSQKNPQNAQAFDEISRYAEKVLLRNALLGALVDAIEK